MLQVVELLTVELFASALPEVQQGIERPGRRPDDGQPSVARQLLPPLTIDPLPRREDRTLGIDEQAVEVEDERPDPHYSLQIALEELEQAPLHVRAVALGARHMPLVRIEERFEWLPGIDQRLHEAGRVPEMDR